MGLERATGGAFDLCQQMFVAVSFDNFAKCDARGQPEGFPACQKLAGELIKEGKPLFVGSVPAKPGNGMMKGGG